MLCVGDVVELHLDPVIPTSFDHPQVIEPVGCSKLHQAVVVGIEGIKQSHTIGLLQAGDQALSAPHVQIAGRPGELVALVVLNEKVFEFHIRLQ
ncbi:hypothetical protein D3C77_287330 [compost metagenome]